MRKKLEGNGLWESSRWTLARIEAEQHKRELHDRPMLTEDSREDISLIYFSSGINRGQL